MICVKVLRHEHTPANERYSGTFYWLTSLGGKGLSLLDFTRWGITLLLLSSLVYTKCLGFEVVVVVALGAVRVVDMDFYGM